jgi:glycosyltransferase involved in cell wall biosynthesis
MIRRQPRTKLPIYLAMADVLVSPREPGGNLPLKIFDYMAAGKPIIAVDSPTHRTVLNNGNAMLVGHSAEQMAAAIVRLLRNPQEAARLGIAARQYAEANLSWKSFVELVSRVYDQADLLSRRAQEARD